MEVERRLTDAQRDEFEDMLRSLTLERGQIKEAMGFALDNADAAGEVTFKLVSCSNQRAHSCEAFLSYLTFRSFRRKTADFALC